MDIEALANRAGITLTGETGRRLPHRRRELPRTDPAGVRGVAADRDRNSNRRIAEELYIAPKTAGTHLSNILAKLGASSRTEAAAKAHRLGLVVG
jgi:FixJ family two-component response regulator